MISIHANFFFLVIGGLVHTGTSIHLALRRKKTGEKNSSHICCSVSVEDIRCYRGSPASLKGVANIGEAVCGIKILSLSFLSLSLLLLHHSPKKKCLKKPHRGGRATHDSDRTHRQPRLSNPPPASDPPPPPAKPKLDPHFITSHTKRHLTVSTGRSRLATFRC